MASDRARAKNRAWTAFSLYIRTRDAIRTMGNLETGRCITCNMPIQVKGSDAGHFIPGRSDAILFEETNCHLQCMRCNRFQQGNFVEYEMALRELYGEEEVERLKQLKFTVKKYSISEYLDIQKEYKEKLKKLYLDYS